MKLTLLKSKIHRATVTAASLHYEGSLTISADLAALVQLREYEKILVGNLRNGERFETYVIYGSPQKGSISAHGALAMAITSFPSHYDQLSATTAVPFVGPLFSLLPRRREIAADTAANEDLNK